MKFSYTIFSKAIDTGRDEVFQGISLVLKEIIFVSLGKVMGM